MANLKTKTKKPIAAILALSTLVTAMTVNAGSAQAWWRSGYGYGPAVGLGVLGGVAAGAVIANSGRPYPYYGPGYYVDGPVCHIERRRVYLDDQSYRIRRVRVCE